MTLLSVQWVWRLLDEASPRNPQPRRRERPAMEIELERLPDRLWSDLGFPRLRPREQHEGHS